jgi:hypothetical protein
MLIEFRVGNFRSFAEPQTFSLVASADTKHPDNCVPFRKLQLLKSAAVFGANASGKSNLIRAIYFMRWFVLHSATRMNVGDPISVVPFQLDPNLRVNASFFEAAFVVEEVRYQYGFSATSQRVHDEWLIAYPKGRPQHLLDRRFDLRTQETTWAFRGDLQKAGTLLKDRTRDNGLALSRGAELNVAPLTTVLLWFQQKMLVLDLSNSPELLIQQTAMRIKEDTAFRERILKLIRHADLGISGLEVDEEKDASRVFNPSGKASWYAAESRSPFVTRVLAAKKTDTGYSATISFFNLRSLHQSADGQPVWFSFLEAESNGTQRFFALVGPWLDALDQGALLVIDELDCSMHPTLTEKLVELFQSPDANQKGAQLVFSTHDSTLMDVELFRRDQIWIVEKDRAGASRLSSLYDFEEKPRNNEALQRRYLAGHYGGIPVFGPTFEDLELP